MARVVRLARVAKTDSLGRAQILTRPPGSGVLNSGWVYPTLRICNFIKVFRFFINLIIINYDNLLIFFNIILIIVTVDHVFIDNILLVG